MNTHQEAFSAYILSGVHITETRDSNSHPWEWCFIDVNPRDTPEAAPYLSLGTYYYQPDNRGFTTYANCAVGAEIWIKQNCPDRVAAANYDAAEYLRHNRKTP